MNINEIITKWRDATGISEGVVSNDKLIALCLCFDLGRDVDYTPKQPIRLSQHTTCLSTRALRALIASGCRTIEDAKNANTNVVWGQKNCGKGTIREIEEWILSQKEARK